MTQAQQSLLGDAPLDVGDDSDFWPTPEYAITAIVPVLQARIDLRRDAGRPHLLDPGCGEGVILDTVIMNVECCSGTGVETHPGRADRAEKRCALSIWRTDFLDPGFPAEWHRITDPERPTLVVMNPPFSKPRQSIGLEFFEQAIRCAEPSRGIVAGLAPLDYACAKDRTERLHDKWSSGLYPFKNRLSFANGQTGKRPLAWFVFDLLNPYSEWRVLQA